MAIYFDTNLKYIREKKGLSQNKLAHQIGVNQTTIARWESKEIAPSIDNAEDVANALNVPLPDLLAIDLRFNNEIKKTVFNKNGVEITLAHDGELNDETLLEINNRLLNEKILMEKLTESDVQNKKK